MNGFDMTDDISTTKIAPTQAPAPAADLMDLLGGLLPQAETQGLAPGNDVRSQTVAPEQREASEVPSPDEEEVGRAVELSPAAPEFGQSILLPSTSGLNGRPTWEALEGRNRDHKLRRAYEAGRAHRGRYVQPVDIVLVMAGTQATKSNEVSKVEGDLVQGLLPRQAEFAVRLQSACGSVKDTKDPKGGSRPTGVSVVSVLSDTDHRDLMDQLDTSGMRDALRMATKGRASKRGPLRSVLTDPQGRMLGFSLGQGLNFFPLSTSKDGGGKSLTAYAQTCPRGSIDRQHDLLSMLDVALLDSANPVVVPPVLSIGGTSIDALLAFMEEQSEHIPEGAFQYVTTTPQDRLSQANVVNATRKKIQSAVLLTAVDAGSVVSRIPVVLLDMDTQAVNAFVEFETMRLAMERITNLQSAGSMDRRDVIVHLRELQDQMGQHTAAALIWDELGGSTRFQHRDLYLGHAMPMNEHDIERLASGRSDGMSLMSSMQKTVARAYAQVYGRGVGDIELRNEHLHRAKLKTAHVVAYVPDNLAIFNDPANVTRFEDALKTGLHAALGHERGTFPVLVTTYRVPMPAGSYPTVGVKLMTHTKDLIELLAEDTPELWDNVLTGLTIDDMQNKRRGNSVKLENRKFRHEVDVLRSPVNQSVRLFGKWADALDRVLKLLFAHGGSRSKHAFCSGDVEDASPEPTAGGTLARGAHHDVHTPFQRG